MKQNKALLAALLAAGVSLLSPGDFMRGWLAAFLLLWAALATLHKAAAEKKELARLTLLAFLLRLFVGMALYWALPLYGYDNPVQNSGYIFYDAHRRDGQAWELAQPDRALLQAFSRSTITDQYGGLLYLSAMTYRFLSPDAHRPLLVVIWGAWAAALGLPFLWRLVTSLGGEKVARVAALWYLAYPESVLLGAAQMRAPFLMAAVIILTWGILSWRTAEGWQHKALTAGALFLLLTFSPGVAAFALLGAGAGGLWLMGRQNIAWKSALGVLLAALLALGVFSQQVVGEGGWLAALTWLKQAASWDMYLLTRQSGWVDKLLGEMPSVYHALFVAGFGLAQPVLPATLIEPAAPLWHGLNFLRAAGWYLLVAPLLVAVPVAATDRSARGRLILSLAVLAWVWILLASVRAGGDMWDNPRYRTIFIGWQALAAAYGWQRARSLRNPWPWRVVSAEVIFLLFFSEWYLSRYTAAIPRLAFWQMVLAIWGGTLLAWLGEWLWRRRKMKKQ